MSSKKEPVFRKAHIPWYHTTAAYMVVIISMLVVFMFGITGISVAREFEKYHGYVWVPALLVGLSTIILISAIYRLLIRYLTRPSNSFLS